MPRLKCLLLPFLLLASWALAQQSQTQPQTNDEPSQEQLPAQNAGNREGGSSSRDTRIDLSPPKDDAKNHPYSTTVPDSEAEPSDVQEFHSWDPHKAAKDIEVGDFYFKRKNYKAALDRYREALLWKPNDALANLHMGQCFEKLGKPDEAGAHYREYLKILPHGQFSEEAQKAVERLQGEKSQASDKTPPAKP